MWLHSKCECPYCDQWIFYLLTNFTSNGGTQTREFFLDGRIWRNWCVSINFTKMLCGDHKRKTCAAKFSVLLRGNRPVLYVPTGSVAVFTHGSVAKIVLRGAHRVWISPVLWCKLECILQNFHKHENRLALFALRALQFRYSSGSVADR